MRKLLWVVLSIISTMAVAQENGEDKLGSWHMYFGTNQIADKWSIHTEAQLRYFEQAKNFNQLLLRTGLNYHIDGNAIATAGYAFIKTDPTYFESAVLDLEEPASDKISEHRIFEQFILKNKVWELLFEHRYRLEQRFITDSDLNTKSTQHRTRYRLQMTVPLTDIFFLNFYDEIFINLQNEAFDQNRLYAAVGVNVTNNLSVQAGYLKNHFRTVNYDRLQVAVFYNPDLRGLFGKK
ncbi:DUF2490 domain-containing protein [Maribacter litopenaei]|uniref:DUF2490 domain-containing protein n=1 Tax=Maribacter litopenaei TaxID=2976127 RepID=A0ABY5Y3Z4_9FLAO|nr:DUF2490 domain-containing protein [Maribacter litopenaei]UWX53737.1 DUF2490 domain-containing protein [Maribacter litopenaei]